MITPRAAARSSSLVELYSNSRIESGRESPLVSRITELMSRMALSKVRMATPATVGPINGTMTLQRLRSGVAPQVRAACSCSRLTWRMPAFICWVPVAMWLMTIAMTRPPTLP